MILYGPLFQKANSRRLVHHKGKSRVIKSENAIQCTKDFTIQARAQWEGKPLEGPVCLTATIYYRSRLSDLCASLLCDILEGICYQNDRQITEMVLYKKFDKKNPRVIVEVEEI